MWRPPSDIHHGIRRAGAVYREVVVWMNAKKTECIDPVELARFMDGELSGAVRLRVVEHLDECDDCRELVAESVQVCEALPAAPAGRARWRSPMMLGGVVLAAAAALALLVWTPLMSRVRGDRYQSLVLAVGSFRTVEARITGGFAYGPLRAPVRGSTDGAATQNLPLLSAAAALQSVATTEPTAENLRSAGVAYLVLGTYDEAVRSLEASTALDAANARAHSDLAAAYLARGSRSGVPADYARGAESAARALALDATLVEPYFNRALALERLGLTDQARTAWQEYLRRDPGGEWSAEGARHLAALTRSAQAFPDALAGLVRALAANDSAGVRGVVAAYPLAVRDYLYDRVLTDWADAVLAGQNGAPALKVARQLSAALETDSGDRLASAIVGQVVGVKGDEATTRLARLQREWSEARRLLAGDQLAGSMPIFRHCERLAATLRHPLQVVCAYQATTSTLNADGQSQSFEALEQIADKATREGFFGLLGSALWRRALIRTNRGDLGGALDEYRHALEAFVKSGETDNVANVHSLMSETLRSVGDLDNAWREHAAALQLSAPLWTPKVRHQILVQVVLTSLEAGLPWVALSAVEQLVAEDTAWQHAGSLALARAHQARVLSRLGRTREALASLASAYDGLSAIPDRDYQRRFETEVRLAEVEVNDPAAPDVVIDAATHAIDNLRHINALGRLPGFLFARARAAARRGDVVAAENDYREAVNTLDVAQKQLRGNVLQISHLERNFSLIRNLAEFELAVRRDPARALEYLEQSRARWLLTQVDRKAGPVRPESLPAVIPADTAVVFYGCFERTLHAWVLTSTGIEYQPLGDVSEIVPRTERVWAAMQSRKAGDIPELVELYRLLVAPLRRAIGTRTRLIVVPDGPIFSVPLAALRESATGRYLVEDVSLEMAPSLSLVGFGREESVLVTSVGIFGGTSGVGFLAAAADEQQAVAAAYGRSSVRRYTGNKDEFLREVDAHDVVHFAGHAIANAVDPAMSLLQFPGDHEVAGAGLLAADLVGLRLRRVQVVVLAACRTAWGRTVAGEGTLSLAHAFQAAGAHAVVASLWDVDDATTKQLITSLHLELALGRTVRDSLREAQLLAIRSKEPAMREPSAWAAFVASVS